LEILYFIILRYKLVWLIGLLIIISNIKGYLSIALATITLKVFKPKTLKKVFIFCK